MTHLAPDELIDGVDGTLAPGRRGHLDACAACRHELASLRALLHDVRTAPVPEPSPLFWDRLSVRVRQAIDEDSASTPAGRWFTWPVLAPVAALALVVLALVTSVSDRSIVAVSSADDVVTSDLGADSGTAAEIEDQWAVLAELVADLDLESANAEGIVAPLGAADAAVWRLSTLEQQELARLLREELRAGG
jgi:anti-sigma factor RsiW